MRFVTKSGREGTLYLYALTYTDSSDPGCPRLTWRTWAYNLEHAELKFVEGEDSDGWTVLDVARVLDGVDQHRAVHHKPMGV
jgi:hypothetical protein